MSVTLPTHNYEFRVAETTSVSDLMGSGGTATYEGSATSNTTDGVIVNNPNRNEGNYVNLTPPTITDTTYSMEFYFTVVTDNGYHFFTDMAETASSSASEWTLATNNNGTQFWSRNFNDKFNITNTTDPTAGTTYHAVISIQKNGTGNLYINNALTGSDSSVTSTEFTTSPLNVHLWEIGRRTVSNDFYSDIKAYYIRYWDNHALSASEVETLYNNRATNLFNFSYLRINYGDVYLAQTLNKTLADYKAENIPLHDISFGAFPSANRYKQSYAKTLIDLSGEFVHRKHTFYGDISFNNDLSVNNFMIVNNDVSLNAGLIVNGDASFNGNVNVIGDVSLNGTLKLKDKSIETSALNFTIIANEGTFDSAQDVSLNSTFTVQGDFDKYIDTAGNFQTDFSENIVLIPSSLDLDLSGGSATLSGKTGDQAFLNGTYIVKDNSGNTTGNIYDDLHENTAATPGQLSATPDYYWDFRVATPAGNTLADRVSGINATYVGGITSSETTGMSFTERSGWTTTTGATQTEYATVGNVIPGTDFTVEYYIHPTYSFNGFCQIFNLRNANGYCYALSGVFYAGGMNLHMNSLLGSYIVLAHSGSGNNAIAVPYTTPSHVVMSYDDTNKVFKIYVNGSLHSITYDDSSRATGATAENTSYGYASGTGNSNTIGSNTFDNNKIGAITLTPNDARPYCGDLYYVRHYKDKILTDADVAILYTNASTINWDFQKFVNYNKLTSLPKNWNSLQVNSRGNWVYDGSSNYTSYLDEYGRPQTVKGDNYDLTLPFHFYPSKAFLRTTPLLPASSSINPHNYPASVKFLGSSVDDVAASVGTPTYNYDFKHNQSIVDNISNNGGTLQGDASIGADGLTLDGTGDRFEMDPSNFTWGGTNTMEVYLKLTDKGSSTNLGAIGFGGDDSNTGGAYFIMQLTGQNVYGYRQKTESDTSEDTISVDTTTSINYDSFEHHVFVFDPTSGIKYYINGTLVNDSGAAYTSIAQIRSGYEYRIGAPPYSEATNGIIGVFSHLRIWNDVALSSDQVTTLYNNRNNNISFKNSISKYHLLGEFSNKATTVIADSSANYTYNSVVYLSTLPTAVYAWDFRVDTSTSINDSIQNATATYYQTSSTIEDGLAFTGQDAHASIPTGILINSGPSEVSWEIYFKYTTVLGVWDMILHLYLNSSNQLRFAQYGDSGYFTFRYGNVSPTNIGSDSDTNREHKITNLSTSALVDTWIHLIATVEYPSDYTTNGTTIRYYHNGSLINTVTGGGYNTGTSATTSSNNNSIGANNGSTATNYNSSGNIRYLRFFNKKLSEEEVTSLYTRRDQMLLLDGISQNYIHGADFLYDLNRKYYINQLRMIVDQAPDSSGNSYGQYSIDRLAYSGSSFSGKKLENSYPNLYLNTAAHDISYGFTEDHTNIVYDLSHNKNQLPIIDMSGGGGIHIAPREISIQDGSLNTINIHKPIIKNTYSKPTYAENTYSSVAPATDASFNTDFYSNFGARDASDHFNKRISQDGKTIVTLQNRGTQGYDLSNAEVVFSTDYGKNWKNILRDCSDSFLFTENDISYGLLFATGDVSGAIDIATSSNGQTMYVGRHRSIFSDANTLTYGELGYSPPQELSIPAVAATNTHTHNNYGGNVTNFRYFPQCFIGNNTGSSDITVSNLTGNEAAFNGTFKVSMSSGLSITNSGHKNLWGILGTDAWSGQYGVNGYTLQASNFNNNRPTVSYVGGSVTLHYLLLEFPAYVKFDTWYYWVDDRFRTGSFIGTDANGDNQLLGSWSDSWNNGQAIYARSFNGANNTYVNKLYIMLDNQGIAWGYLQPMWFTGSYQLPETRGAPIPTNGLPEIYSTNYGNSWKLSPRKYHKGPTIISGDGSTILILQESKLNNTKHAYTAISSHGNDSALVDTHWITKDYGSNWNTLNRSGYDISNNVIPPSYGSKTASFLKACMSYTGQYIYIYNVQCTTNNNYGELYYSHDYGNTWNKWTTSEAQNYIASGNALAGSGQILCSGNGKYVFIAGQTASSSRLSQAIYYRSTDYGVTFNKDITTFPWQEGSSGEDSTSRGPFISYEGDLIVISNTHYKYIDDSDATISYGSSQYSGLKYSLDYGVNYNVLELNEEPLSTVTNNFSNLPNQTNEFFSSLFSTKGDIFSNCPGPNDYSFLTTVMGGNTTDASFVFLQSIEFPKDKVSTTVEKEGPVITTYEEPIDTENDFGNITNTTSLTSGVSFYSSAISEDGQVLLSAGATDVSLGNYYGGYNLTNAKFPPTENVYDTTGNGILQPHRDYNFLITGAASSTMSDNISGSEGTYGSNVTSTTTNGLAINGNGGTSVDAVTLSSIEFSTSFTLEFVIRLNSNNNYAGICSFKQSAGNEIVVDMYSTQKKLRFYMWSGGGSSTKFASHGQGTHDGTLMTVDGSTYHHMVCLYNNSTQQAEYYQDGVRVWYQSGISIDESRFPIVSSDTSALGDINLGPNFNMKYFRIWNNRALSSSEITTLYNNQNTVYTANSWIPHLPHFKTAQLSYNGNYAMAIPYGITQTNAQYLYYWSASGDFHRFDKDINLSYFDAENWKFGKLSGNGNFFVGFTHSSTTLTDASYNNTIWWQDKVSNTMIIYKNLYTMPRGIVSDSDATTYGQGTTYDLNNAFSTDSGVTEYYITSVHVSETGQYVLFVGGNSATTLTNRCAFSKDYGVTFTNITALFSFTDITKPLVYCHVSDNGRYLFISQYNSSEYCFSTDYGASFTLHNTFPSSTKTYGVVSKDGQNALFMDTNKHVYVSVNGNFRQEVIPSLSGTNTNLSLNHNYWKYKTTLTEQLNYNPSMPNIKYLTGITNDIPLPTYDWNFLTTAAAGSVIYDKMSNRTGTYNDYIASDTTNGATTTTTQGTVEIPAGSITLTSIYSIEFFVRCNENQNGSQIFQFNDVENTNVLRCRVWAGVLLFQQFTNTDGVGGNQNARIWTNSDGYTGTYTGPTISTDGTTWNHFVLSIDNVNGAAYMYQNGSQIFHDTEFTGVDLNAFPRTYSNYIRIGKSTADTRISIKYFRVWPSYALSAAEVTTLYNNRETTNYISSSLSSNSVRYTESYFSELDIKGSLTNLSGTAYTSSDYRVKENVRDLEDSDSITSLTPISYTQNNLHHKKSIGFLAHEFAESFPDLVDGTKDGPEMQSINYNGIIAVLIKEIQILRTKINKLKSEI